MAVGKSKISAFKKQKAKGKKASSPKHAQLDVSFAKQGSALAKAPDMQSKPKPVAAPSKARKYFRDAFKSKPSDRMVLLDRFGGKYRRLAPRNDELISTASVRSMLGGMLKAKLSASAQENLSEVLDEISSVRLPTIYVGFATKGKKMQHPTIRKQAVFADPHGTGSAHAAYDLARRTEVSNAIDAELKANPGNARSAVRAGLRAAISFTLNEMAAPPTASDVRPYLWKPISDAKGKQVVAQRETLKAIYVKLGGVQETDVASATASQRLSRRWRNSSRATPTSAVSATR
ncbi:hypothetical protein [Brevundimonas sp.]|jgi:phage tail protein X|uniref:hypothetical protein n=1 Tax=Brevundimonas sp. TaxID=1871086 RepID=UPI002E12B490|nr:hypothetical protein [Brevundimonas sp.]